MFDGLMVVVWTTETGNRFNTVVVETDVVFVFINLKAI